MFHRYVGLGHPASQGVLWIQPVDEEKPDSFRQSDGDLCDWSLWFRRARIAKFIINHQGLGLMSVFGDWFHITKPNIYWTLYPQVSWTLYLLDISQGLGLMSVFGGLVSHHLQISIGHYIPKSVGHYIYWTYLRGWDWCPFLVGWFHITFKYLLDIISQSQLDIISIGHISGVGIDVRFWWVGFTSPSNIYWTLYPQVSWTLYLLDISQGLGLMSVFGGLVSHHLQISIGHYIPKSVGHYIYWTYLRGWDWCPFLVGWFHITFKYLLDIISPSQLDIISIGHISGVGIDVPIVGD